MPRRPLRRELGMKGGMKAQAFTASAQRRFSPAAPRLATR